MRKKKNIAFSLFGLIAIALALFAVIKSDKFQFFEQRLTISCPVPKEYCKKGTPLYRNGKLIGLGFNLPHQTQLKAGFAGKLQQGGQGDGKKMQFHPIVWLLGEGEFDGYIATYSFYGTPIYDYLPQKFTQTMQISEAIGNVSFETFPKEKPYNGVNFIFSLHKGEKTSPPLPPSAFEFK